MLEANPRASRTVPLVSKVCNIQMARIATEIMSEEITGRKPMSEYKLKRGIIPHYGVKEAVFPFNMFPEVDPVLGPEMRSTGEVLGLAGSFGIAFFKAQEATGTGCHHQETVLISVADEDKAKVHRGSQNFFASRLQNQGNRPGTCDFLIKKWNRRRKNK